MIKETLKIFSQNVRKNKTLINTILENNKNNMDIILIQELPKSLIRHVLSHTDLIGDPIYSIPNHPDWTLFIRQDPAQESYAQVATYVNKKLLKMRFTLRLNIINHRDVNVLAFHSGQHINYIINVYSDDNQSVLHTLNQNIVDLNDTVVMTGDFNIRDNDWDPNYPHYSTHTEDLFTLAESLGLDLLPPINPGPTSVRVTGAQTPGESSVNITVSGYDTTYLQENSQRIR